MLPVVDEKSPESGVTVITDGGSSRRDRAEIKASYKKYIIVAVAVIVVVAVAVGGALGAVHISNKTAQDVWKEYHLRFTNKDGTSENENIKVNVKDNVTVYNVPDERFHVAMDNPRGLVVYKMEMNNRFACYVTPMNKSDEADSKDVANSLEKARNDEINNPDEDEQTQYVANSSPIKDRSFLSPKIRDFCKDLEAYWLTEKDDGAVDGATTKAPAEKSRQKRACYYQRITLRRYVVIYRYGRRYVRYYYYSAVRRRCYG
ncbi:leukocyte cell-derived chemotaxin 1-like isoform X2 [Lingula anatina]|uniref:Leukocyte cell-derived chemotaxin 1-like isoform X2 n=1 Tax=Lingula anatina TaxID=7574 RepID=A0A1S3HUM2_LINAN|nr:leukocyte cell-derived chemotaxin 1-like isoform X2 [Lingula anatina]|eukprot:XP_013389742.1 leukocyte cell-derived chemotaxin 1-like isoform X2 [Lingula anatina]